MHACAPLASEPLASHLAAVLGALRLPGLAHLGAGKDQGVAGRWPWVCSWGSRGAGGATGTSGAMTGAGVPLLVTAGILTLRSKWVHACCCCCCWPGLAAAATLPPC